MTEAEWLNATDPHPMLAFLRDRESERKFRLFAVAAVWPLVVAFGDAATQKVVEVVSEAAEGTLSRGDLRDERHKISTYSHPTRLALPTAEYVTRAAGLGLEADPLRAALNVVSTVTHLEAALQTNPPADQPSRDSALKEVRRQCSCRLVSHVCDVFGNPFRSAGVKRQWRTDTVLTLAAGMYDSRDFSAMPILADALQDAGCDSADVLDHCRSPEPHVRGCWVVDALLGKS